MPTGSSQSGSDQLIKELEGMYSDLNSEVEKKLTEVGEKLTALAIEKTPASEKKVLKGYKVTRPRHYGKERIAVEVTNTAVGFDALETGYKTVNEKGHADGYVPGRHMLENAYTQVNKNIVAEFEEVIKKVIK